MGKLLLPAQAQAWLAKRYESRHREWLEGDGEWPLGLALGQPTERDFGADAAGVRAWVQAWGSWVGPGTLVWDERRWPRLGTQRLPARLELATPAEVAAWAGQAPRWARAGERAAALAGCWPQLASAPGLGRLFGVLADWAPVDFERLVAVLDWLLAHPDSGLYLRQLPVAGLDSKWLEQRTGVVLELLALLRGAAPQGDFFEACGLRRAPHRLRLAVLCPVLRFSLGGLRDVEAPVADMASLPLRPRAVLVVENLASGLALPDMAGVVAFMRLGHAVGALAALPWLRGVPAYYWGDIDTHGLAILERARRALPGLRALLMDEATLLAHRALWGEEPQQHPHAPLEALSADERCLFEDLRGGRWAPRVRLEQERLPWDLALAAMAAALDDAGLAPRPRDDEVTP